MSEQPANDQPIDIRPDHAALVRDILTARLPEGVRVQVFGSRAKWLAKPYSDLDLALEGDGILPDTLISDLKEDFTESDLPWKVDVLDLNAIAPSFRALIDEDRVVFSLGGEWRKTKWRDVISLEYGKAIRGYQNAIAPYRVYGANGPVGWAEAPLAPSPGIILGRKGAYRGVQFSREPFFVIDTAYYVKPKSEELDMRWLYYAIIYHKLGEINDGSPIPSTTRAAVYVRDIEVPPLSDQRAIASILGALDDKIDLNRRMNATLEAMARAIFRDWFVDFGPTRAKMAASGSGEGAKNSQTCTAPYLAPEIWDLFPDRLGEDGLPVGWVVGTLADIAESPRRGIRPSDVAEETPYIGLEHMPRRSIALSKWEGANKVSSNKSRFRKGEFLFGKLRPYFHKVGVAAIDGICSTDIIVLKPKGQMWSAFALACLSSDSFVDYTNSSSTGTKMPRTSWKIMGAYKLCLPPSDMAQVFETMVSPMIEKIIANIHQPRTLAQIRDLLLPRLMSGEIRVREAEKLAEDTG